MSLKPTLIQYSSGGHREGIRKYFEGEYKIDYGFLKEKQWKSETYDMKNRNIIRHRRSHTCNLDQYGSLKLYKNQSPAQLYHSRFHTDCPEITKQNQKLSKSIKELDLETKPINLPKISKIRNNPEDSEQETKNKDLRIKGHLYACGNQRCQTKGIPTKPAQVSNKSKSKKCLKVKKKQHIKQMSPIRMRYTPTFVCSNDNPLPCFKIYDKFRFIQQ